MKFLTDQAGRKIVYDKISGNGAEIVFLGGLKSDRQGKKALYLEEYAKKHGYNFIRFDYLGHGDSDLAFHECGLDEWLSSVLLVIDELTKGPVILVGSSLGGWLSYLAALHRRDRVVSLLSLAPAPDFTEDLMWDIFAEDIKAKINNGEIYHLPSDYCEGSYPISKKLIESGRKYLLLRDQKKIEINIPVTIIHGIEDEDVPYKYSLKLVEKLSSEKVKLILLKDGNHSLSDPEKLKIITQEIDQLI